jgi:hypothetical protein
MKRLREIVKAVFFLGLGLLIAAILRIIGKGEGSGEHP